MAHWTHGVKQWNVIGGWSLLHITTPMRGIADQVHLINFWQQLFWRILSKVAADETYCLAPLGTFFPRHYAARNYPGKKIWVPPSGGVAGHWIREVEERPAKVRLGFRASRWLNQAILANIPPTSRQYPSDIYDAAIAAGLTPLQAQQVWPLMYKRVAFYLRRGGSIYTPQVGSFFTWDRHAWRYWRWSTSTPAVSPRRRIAQFAPDRSADRWITNNTVPAPSDIFILDPEA